MFDVDDGTSFTQNSRRNRLNIVVETQDQPSRNQGFGTRGEKFVGVRYMVEYLEHADRVDSLGEQAWSHNIVIDKIPQRRRSLFHRTFAGFHSQHFFVPL